MTVARWAANLLAVRSRLWLLLPTSSEPVTSAWLIRGEFVCLHAAPAFDDRDRKRSGCRCVSRLLNRNLGLTLESRTRTQSMNADEHYAKTDPARRPSPLAVRLQSRPMGSWSFPAHASTEFQTIQGIGSPRISTEQVTSRRVSDPRSRSEGSHDLYKRNAKKSVTPHQGEPLELRPHQPMEIEVERIRDARGTRNQSFGRPLLAAHFCSESCQRGEIPPMTLTNTPLSAVEFAEWPGNVRQLAS